MMLKHHTGIYYCSMIFLMYSICFLTESGLVPPAEFLFSMQEQVEELSGASISAEIPLIRQIQDTTVYNAKAIKTLKDSDLRQLLEMLPGFEVSENAIMVDGRPVNRTYVNGKLVFGDKVTTALDALRADEVSEVKVYDELSDIDKHRGVRNARKNRVLDIVTKDSFISIAKASAAVSGGADQTGQIRYATAGVLEFHSEMFQAEALLDCSNIKGLNDNQALSTLASSPAVMYDNLKICNLSNRVYSSLCFIINENPIDVCVS